ncbi:hypothetical protein FRC12_011194 [Ceratobasidium sp. 428]|nr:hypothetical protein FRC12_011194 [Ceratobasidium sp. 428]
MDADDAVSEKILSAPTADNMATELEPLLEAPAPPRRPIVLVPDSDPIGSSQVQSQPNYARGSSPWDIESSAPSQLHSDRLSPEVAKSGSNKGKRRYSPMLSSPLQPSGSLFNPSQLSGQQSDLQKTSTGSGNSQESAAAASLPSPPPEHPPTQPTPSQPHARFSPDITNEPTARDQQSGNEKVMESFDNMPRVEPGVRTSPNRRKRRRSPSRVRDGGLTLASVGGVAIVAHGREMETTKRRRLDDPNTPLAQERAVAREDITETRFPQTANTNDDETSTNRPDPNAPNPQDAGAPLPRPRAASPPNLTVPQDVIPHDHDAWAAPSYMAAQPKVKAKEGKLVKGNASNAPRAVSISSSVASLPGLPRRQVLDPKPRISLPLPRHLVARRAVSPELPPVTASQVADADEDADIRSSPASKLASKPGLKVEPPTPARPTKSRASILSSTPSRPRSSISYVGSGPAGESSTVVLPKVARTSTATTTTKQQESRVHSASAGASINTTAKPKPQDELRPAKPRASGVGTGKAKNVSKNAEESAGGPSTQRKLLGGFKPSVLPSLEDQFISTWAMWLESVQEAESFWESV